MLGAAKAIILSGLKDRVKLYLLEHIGNKCKEEIKFNTSQYIRSIQNSSIEAETSTTDLDKFIYNLEYALNNLGIKLNSQEQSSILGAIKIKYLNKYQDESIKSAAFYISRPSKDIWTIFGTEGKSSHWLLGYQTQDEIEQLFIDFILDKISEL